eukprot:g3447.t1
MIQCLIYFGGGSNSSLSSAVGFSGVLFSLAMVECFMSTTTHRNVFGFFRVPTQVYPWVLLLLLSLIPGISFWGHLSGILAGLLYTSGIIQPLLPSRFTVFRWENHGSTELPVTDSPVATASRFDGCLSTFASANHNYVPVSLGENDNTSDNTIVRENLQRLIALLRSGPRSWFLRQGTTSNSGGGPRPSYNTLLSTIEEISDDEEHVSFISQHSSDLTDDGHSEQQGSEERQHEKSVDLENMREQRVKIFDQKKKKNRF